MAISDDRLKHMIGVARHMYKTAKEDGHSEKFARQAFVIGLLHDIGYEFEDSGEHHAEIAGNILKDMDFTRWEEIKSHGNPSCNFDLDTVRYLNEADMSVSHDGKEVTIEERLLDIKERYGENSEQYTTAKLVANKIREHYKNITR